MLKEMRLNTALPKVSRALFVIAHPDDETMFFSPIILALLAESCRVFVLCLSTGGSRTQLLLLFPPDR